MHAQVALLKAPNQERYLHLKETLDLIQAATVLSPTDRYLINPNWIIDEHANQGNVTDTDTLRAVVRYLIEVVQVPATQILVADGGYPRRTKRTMKTNEVKALISEFGVSVTDLNDEDYHTVTLESSLALKTVNICESAWNADCIISVPSLKTHGWAVTTLAMKNMMGVILPKGIMHSRLHMKIADLISVLRPKMKLSIIDGIVGSEGNEEGGSPVQMDILAASTDPVALDTVGSAIIGYSPAHVKYLKYATEKGLGTSDLSQIEVLGETINHIFQKFAR